MVFEYRKYLETLPKRELIDLIVGQCETSRVCLPANCWRKIAIRICYFGEKYHGLVVQENKPTIEGCIRDSLARYDLVDPSKCNIEFAGRTDKGVSALNMVASLMVKSRGGDISKEYNYTSMLNASLPHDIRITGWFPVDDDFSARFSCKRREYKYFFFRENMDIERARGACDRFKELVNFKRFCRKSESRRLRRMGRDVKEEYYFRKLDDIRIDEIGNDIYVLSVSGRSFLHNMIRKIFYALRGMADGTLSYNCLENNEECFGTADAENLLFVNAHYDENLEFIGDNAMAKYFYEKLKKSGISNAIHRFNCDEFVKKS
jgi:tRNA pseudouridine38/39 synthase